MLRKLYQEFKRRRGSINVIRKFPGKIGGDVTLFPGSIAHNSELEGYNYIHNAALHKSKFGIYTYVGPNTKISNASIGRFCSIASDVSIGLGIHPSRDFVSMHPSFYSLKNTGVPLSFLKEQKAVEGKNIEIGHDVWIGHRAIILDGVKIGHGAAIGAASLVTKDIPPYAIVGGVPAKVIRYRFTDEEIEKLLEFKWWERNEDWIKAHADYFENINLFKKIIQKK
jgi:acetyltransferase-like isoleucine patch superfamily enzyme